MTPSSREKKEMAFVMTSFNLESIMFEQNRRHLIYHHSLWCPRFVLCDVRMNAESFDIETRVIAGNCCADGTIIKVDGIEYDGAVIHLVRDELRCKFGC